MNKEKVDLIEENAEEVSRRSMLKTTGYSIGALSSLSFIHDSANADPIMVDWMIRISSGADYSIDGQV